MGCKDIGPFILSRLSTPEWMRSKRDLELPEEALISFFPQMGDIWVLYSGYFMEFRKSDSSIQACNFTKTHGNQGISFDMPPDQCDLDKEREF